jgi:hypothetical protein
MTKLAFALCNFAKPTKKETHIYMNSMPKGLQNETPEYGARVGGGEGGGEHDCPRYM